MPLTHVYYWDPTYGGYRPISVEEAVGIYNHGLTVHADDRSPFVCWYCKEYVGLSTNRIDTGKRYFYHSNTTEQTKECEDRTANPNPSDSIEYDRHIMPLKIDVNETNGNFKLLIGFPLFKEKIPDRQKIIITDDSGEKIEYQISPNVAKKGITYLSVGHNPSRTYHFYYEPKPSNSKYFLYPSTSGIRVEGTFFDGNTGHIIHPGGKVYPDQDYYLLTQNRLNDVPSGITSTEVSFRKYWHLYSIHINSFSESSALFFLRHEIFLTERPIGFFPVWPPIIRSSFALYHNQQPIYFYLLGEADNFKIFPEAKELRSVALKINILYKIRPQFKEQLIALGPHGGVAIAYLIPRDEDNSLIAHSPNIKITSGNGEAIIQKSPVNLPDTHSITIRAPFDGKLIKLLKGKIELILPIKANEEVKIKNLSIDHELRIYQACDLVQTITFKKAPKRTNRLIPTQDQQLLSRLEACKGELIPISHCIGALALRLTKMPMTRCWLYKIVRHGNIRTDALRILIRYRTRNMNQKEI